jgi:hypothetical protein
LLFPLLPAIHGGIITTTEVPILAVLVAMDITDRNNECIMHTSRSAPVLHGDHRLVRWAGSKWSHYQDRTLASREVIAETLNDLKRRPATWGKWLLDLSYASVRRL